MEARLSFDLSYCIRFAAAVSSQPDQRIVCRNCSWGFSIMQATFLLNSQQQLALKTALPIMARSEACLSFKNPGLEGFLLKLFGSMHPDLSAGSGRVDSPTYRELSLHTVRLKDQGHNKQVWNGNEDYMLVFRQHELAKEKIKANKKR